MKYSVQSERGSHVAAKQPHYKLQYLPLFWDDLNVAVSYISDTLKAPEAAERLLNQTEAAILQHLESPENATICKSTHQHELPYYWFPVGNYMVFYVVFDNVMEVRRFLFGSRDLTKLIP